MWYSGHCFRKRRSIETIQPLGNANPTGLSFKEQSLQDLVDAVNSFEANESMFDYENCRSHALKFSVQRFNDEIASFISTKYRDFLNNKNIKY